MKAEVEERRDSARDENAPAYTPVMTPMPDARVFAELARVAALPGGSPLSTGFYDAHRGESSLGTARLIQRWGSWQEVCSAAGVTCHAAVRTYSSTWSEEELLGWVRRFLAESSGTSYAAFTAWAREHKSDGAPSAQTVRNRFGGWADAVKKARAAPES